MYPTSKKNIPHRIADVASPRHHSAHPAPDPTVEAIKPRAATKIFRGRMVHEIENAKVPPPTRARPSSWQFVLIFSVIVVAGGALWTFLHYQRELHLARSAAGQLSVLEAAIPDVQDLNFDAAREKLKEGRSGFRDYFAEFAPGFALGDDIFGSLRNAFQGLGSAAGNLQKLSNEAFALLEVAEDIRVNWLRWTLGHDGERLLERLGEVRVRVAELARITTDLVANENIRTLVAPNRYVPLQLEINRAEKFLNEFVPWLAADEPRRILVLLGNSAELRPGGGFVGSYAEVIVRRGSVENVTIRDINEADREFAPNIVPPKALQGVVRRWRAADANWFFDFPTSAEKIMSFLEGSAPYARDGIRFDGVVSVTPRVVGALLDAVGPLELPAHDLTLTSENFLTEIQREVQEGQAEGAPAPKAILAEAAPLLLERLVAKGPALGEVISLSDASAWIEARDLVAYFRHPDFQGFLDALGATGRIYEPPANVVGDYLALVGANIGGGKSDVMIQEKVAFETSLDLDGVANNRLSVRRTNTATDSSPWWYRVPNETYFQIFTPRNAQIVGVTGAREKIIRPRVNYEALRYSVDPGVAAIESSTIEFLGYPNVTAHEDGGKNVFALWQKTAPGETSEFILEYRHRLFTTPVDGGNYQLVLERQSGSARSYTIEVSAPVGFRWRENHRPVFEYETDSLPGRLILELTFEKVL